MNIREIIKDGNICDENNIIRDCEFDRFYLLGKVKPERKKVITFIESEKYIDEVLQGEIEAVVCTKSIEEAITEQFNGGILISDNPRITFFELYNQSLKTYPKDDKETYIGANCNIHESVIIPKNNVYIGDNAVIEPYVVIEEGTNIGDNVIIEPGVKLGTAAFYHIYSENKHVFVKSSGTLFIDSNVTIHSNTMIEKSALGGQTFIGKDVSIDNNTLIGHDSYVGDSVRIAASSTLAGGVYIGEKTQLGVSVSIAPNVHIGKNVQLSIGAVVTKDVPDSVRYSGNFAIEHSLFLRNLKQQVKKDGLL